MTARGFTLVELLLASVITLMLLGAGLTMAASARWSFAVEPAALDTVRRAREGVSALVDAIGGAGGGIAVGDGVWALGTSVPIVRPLTALDEAPGSRFTALWVLRAVPGGVGRLAIAQTGPGGSLTLDRTAACPLTTAVCGFGVDDVAAIFDDRGHLDVFEIVSVSDGQARITPRAPLAFAYGAGAWVLGARVDRIGLVPQSDGSQTLTRITWAGAREPLIEGVVNLDIVAWGRADAPALRDAEDGPGLASYGLEPPAPDEVDDEGVFTIGEHCMAGREGGEPRSRLSVRPVESDGLARLGPSDLEDGPWCPNGGAVTAFDADLFRLRRLDVVMRVEVLSAEFRGPAGRLFTRGGTAALDAPRWIRDRTLSFSVAIAGR
ncbi:MAG: prepilin-type N-terminal cleavage/methylation domain-containing protein [Acidobacteriota bacterium]|nr:prepilin-type N-terminal cleavage/methylation domain-containing protein [Acidobacteriota bacterium]